MERVPSRRTKRKTMKAVSSFATFSVDNSFLPLSGVSRKQVRRLVLLVLPFHLYSRRYRSGEENLDHISVVQRDIFKGKSIERTFFVPQYGGIIVSLGPFRSPPEGYSVYRNPVLQKDCLLQILPYLSRSVGQVFSTSGLTYGFAARVMLQIVFLLEKQLLYSEVNTLLNDLKDTEKAVFLNLIDKLFGVLKRKDIVEVCEEVKRCHRRSNKVDSMEGISAEIQHLLKKRSTGKKQILELVQCPR